MRGMPGPAATPNPEPGTDSGTHAARVIRNTTCRIHKKAPWHGGQGAKYPNVKSFDSDTISNGAQDLIILFVQNKFRAHQNNH